MLLISSAEAQARRLVLKKLGFIFLKIWVGTEDSWLVRNLVSSIYWGLGEIFVDPNSTQKSIHDFISICFEQSQLEAF